MVFISIQANTAIGFDQQQAAFYKIRCRKPYTKESKICISSKTSDGGRAHTILSLTITISQLPVWRSLTLLQQRIFEFWVVQKDRPEGDGGKLLKSVVNHVPNFRVSCPRER